MTARGKHIVLFGAGLVLLQVLALHLFGQPPICECGFIKLWEWDVWSSGMSQHLTDWYTFSHVIHGFIFYGVLRLIFPRMSVGTRLLIAMGLEIGWEIAENTPYVINAYREQALAQGYVGDSILNSLCDTLSMILGFFLAKRLPVPVTIALAVIFEVFVGVMIRDNLTLNVLNFIYQFDFIYQWQAGAVPAV
ncbi:MAG: hypothetical protein COV91_00245 [Candidatus Taylorbacteria bacterium CG11_big_fil_rev_8_21_14_0_20_46_11]|uniref:Uncharacterized protein n=1 Tax=Candidatus Taylorbacteria bacterium CG11_big_fil_rev_8_21_14_0_20_46_11 TaxID=1975025 RepID=A0A2H0KD36_9BACT|nr:MAG: hypothetical protein COV91_00245 [Candidatus Taylorbacteria bacterium CG11_big_fil_rev_8_21_14_0_20_46_11]